MLEAKIINEMNGTFLLMMSQEKTVGYEVKMFQYNHIKAFLPMEITSMNNIITYRYGIMDYESLTKHFYNTMFNIEDIKHVFLAIAKAGQAATEYLLSPDAILLEPEYIFVKDEEFLFCYYPGNEQTFNRGIRQLMEYILERLNHDNQENVLMAYGLYQKILKNNFTMEMLMEEFYAKKEEQKVVFKKEYNIEESYKPIEVIMAQEPSNEEIIYERKEEIADIIQLEEELSKGNGNNKSRNSKKKTVKATHKKNSLFELFAKKKKSVNRDLNKSEDLECGAGTMLLAEESAYGSTQLLNCKVLKNKGVGKDILLTNFPIYVGNITGDATCKIDNIMVSRRHAVLTWECGCYYLEDQGSTNGTFVNGSRLSPYEPIQIKEGDLISFANESFCLN